MVLGLFLAMLLPGACVVWAQAVNQVPPAPKGLSIYVQDGGNLLSPADEQQLQTRLSQLDESGIAQIVVLTLPTTDRELSDFAPEIFNTWGIGHRGKDNGVLILANAQRIQGGLSGNRIFISTGLAVEAEIPDAVAGRILDEQALPAFAQGQYSTGILNTAFAVAGILQGDQQLKAHYQRPEPQLDWPTLIFLLIFILIWFRGGRRGPFVWVGGGGFPHGGGGFGGGGFGGGFGGGRGGGGGAGR